MGWSEAKREMALDFLGLCLASCNEGRTEDSEMESKISKIGPRLRVG
jgi:hypothetical protein